MLLTQEGAHVSIVARNKEKLETALAKLEVAMSLTLSVMTSLAQCFPGITCLPIPNTERLLAFVEYGLWFY
jgi:hypothetical protein